MTFGNVKGNEEGNVKGNIAGLCVLVVVVAAARVVPHPLNVTPVGALGLFCGAYVAGRWACLLPLAALLPGDLAMGLYDPLVMPFVYLGFACSAFCGRIFLHEQRTIPRFGGGVLAAALAFYLVSNFGMWMAAWPMSWEGLVGCYASGLPYLLRTLAGNALYGVVLFGGYETMKAWRNRPLQVA